MATRRVNESKDSERLAKRRPPSTTPEGREQQLIALAVDLAEQQLRNGTASAQVITNFLKLGSTREQLEQQRMTHEIKLMEAKAEAMASAARVEEMYKDALNAMRSYAGQNTTDDSVFDD